MMPTGRKPGPRSEQRNDRDDRRLRCARCGCVTTHGFREIEPSPVGSVRLVGPVVVYTCRECGTRRREAT